MSGAAMALRMHGYAEPCCAPVLSLGIDARDARPGPGGTATQQMEVVYVCNPSSSSRNPQGRAVP